MANPTTVKELFAPLGERLYKFESNYFSSFYFYAHHSWEDFDDETPDIYQIVKGASVFDPQEVYNEAKLHEERVASIIKELKPLERIKIIDDLRQAEEIEVPKNFRIHLLQKWKEEFDSYQTHLQSIQKIAFKNFQTTNCLKPSIADQGVGELTKQQVIQINLPENFTVKQLNKDFDPQLSVNQVALFLHYLKDLAILPPYSDLSIGKLAEAFFVRNQKNVTKGLTDIYTIKSNEGELSNLKKVLQNLIKQIDIDLKKAS